MSLVFKKTKDSSTGWELASGEEHWTTQTSHRAKGVRQSAEFTFNQPFNCTLKSGSPHGWPQLCLSFTGPDAFGRTVPRGYAVAHIPVLPGSTTLRLPIFRLRGTSWMQDVSNAVSGKCTEFQNVSASLASNYGRERVRSKTVGHVVIHVTTAMGHAT